MPLFYGGFRLNGSLVVRNFELTLHWVSNPVSPTEKPAVRGPIEGLFLFPEHTGNEEPALLPGLTPSDG